ncbi:MAG: amino acid permease [Cyclobacteriaceae bacterium]|nr:amino acid permease [Cyclobacteriaceae bacterium]
MKEPVKYTLSVGIALVIANMIGTGVFTSLGYQVGPLPSGFVILMLWLLGGIIALSGALTYAEISTTLKRSGGEYFYLAKIYHPFIGFISGWMSTAVGFAGAISAVAIAIGSYSSVLFNISEKIVAVASIVLISAVHLFGVKVGGIAQTILTTLKLFLILFFCLAPFFFSGSVNSGISFLPQSGDLDLILTPDFAVSLVFVVYAYTGWNAAAYIAGDLENPIKNLPRALLIGTIAVLVIYLALNSMFMFVATFKELEGQNDIGNVVAIKLFGSTIGQIFSALFSIALLSTLSAMTIAGPRITEAMGEDYPAFRKFATKNRHSMPYGAILLQAGWSIFLVLVSSFKEIIQYISISLSIFSMITVAGVFILRRREKDQPFKLPLYPLPPIIFIVVTSWMIYYMFREDPKIIFYSLATMVPGAILYFSVSKNKTIES